MLIADALLPLQGYYNTYSFFCQRFGKKFTLQATLKEELQAKGIRVEVDDRNEKTGYKIREAQLQKIPYMLVIGAKEVEENAVSVRSREEGDIGKKSVDDFIEEILKKIEEKR